MEKYLPSFLKHKLLIVMILVGLAATGWFSLPDSTILPRNLMLSWTGEPATTMTVNWQTGRFWAYNKVEYRDNSEKEYTVCAADSETVATDKGTITVHSARLTGLKPDTVYQYRVGGGLLWSDYHTFKTAPAKVASFKFLLFGDSQSYDYSLWRNTLTTARERNKDAAFNVNIGDLVDIGLNYTQWNDWFQAGRGIIDSLPVMPVMGNHETYTSDWQIAPPLLYEAFFRLPDNGPAGLKGKVYSYNYGAVHFTVLDTQLQEEGPNIPNMLALEQKWLEKDLASAKQKWKIVLMHRPVHHNRPSSGDEDLRDGLVPIFDKYHVDVVFAGHDHGYARSYPMVGSKWTKEQGPGTVYITTGRSGVKVFERAQAKNWDVVFYNPLDQPNYLTVEVFEDSLNVKAFKLNGELIDQWGKTAQSDNKK